jgi:anti-sigma factor RsiW
MTCRDVLELVEAIAAGDIEPDAALRAHIESCPQCASALASARRIESLLESRPAPAAPARFTPAVLQRIRREQWRTEQNVDRLFNIAMAVAVLLVAGGTLALFNLGGLLSLVGSAWQVASGMGSTAARSAAPSLNTYIAAAALLASALGMWWWADRTLSL